MSRQTLARMDQNLNLMQRMQARLRVRPQYDQGIAAALRWGQATRNCAFCPTSQMCEAWLEEHDEPEAYRRFCPNAELFDSVELEGEV